MGMMALVDFGSHDENDNIIDDDTMLWNNPEVLFSLLETTDEFKESPDEDVFAWEDQKHLNALLDFENENDRTEDVFLWDDAKIAHSLFDDQRVSSRPTRSVSPTIVYQRKSRFQTSTLKRYSGIFVLRTHPQRTSPPGQSK